MKRRQFACIILGGGSAAILGCGRSPLEAGAEMVEELDQAAEDATRQLDTDTIENTRVVLYGFMITAVVVGGALRFLPDPAVRVVSVGLIVTNQGIRLAISYLDEELERREHLESLSEEEAKAIEEVGNVELRLDNGETESVQLSPREYRD